MISVIIPVYEQPVTIEWLLFSLAHQDCDEPWEVLVCDDGSGTDVLTAIRAAQARRPMDLRYIWQPHDDFRASRSRNNAIRCARGDILVFLDGDMVVKPDFLRAHAAIHRAGSRPRLVSSGRRWVFLPDERPQLSTIGDFLGELQAISVDVDQQGQLRMARSASPWTACLGCNLSAPRLPEVSFDEQFVGWGAEDTELACRLVRRQGFELIHAPELEGFHVVLSTRSDWNLRRLSTSHRGVVNYLRNRLRLEALDPEADFANIDSMLAYFILSSATDEWQLAPYPITTRTPGQVLAIARDWLARHEGLPLSTAAAPAAATTAQAAEPR